MENVLIQPKKTVKFHVIKEKNNIESLIKKLPKDEVFKIVSFGGFSSIGFIRFVSESARIKKLTLSTLAVGKKHLTCLDVMHKQKQLEHVRMMVGGIMKDSSTEKRYGYFKTLQETCNKNGWELVVKNNHSKILLFDTDNGKYVLETSSNLNENPSMEQFSFEKNTELYNFYNNVFDEIFKKEGG